MSEFVTDTHELLWHLSNDPALSKAARGVFLMADAGQADIYIPSTDRIIALPAMRGSHYHMVALDTSLVQVLRTIPRTVVPDMPDRIIAATAVLLDKPLLTRDQRIANLTTVRRVW